MYCRPELDKGKKPDGPWILRYRIARDRASEIGPAAFLVYHVLLDHASRATWTCWPSVRTIAARSGLSTAIVQPALIKLKDVGLVKVESGSQSRSNRYTLPLLDTSPPPAGVSESDTGCIGICHTGVSGSATEQEPIEPAPLNRPSSCSDLRPNEEDFAIARWIWAKIQEMQPNRKPPQLNQWANDIRLMRTQDGRTHEQIRTVFEWAHADPFWKTNILSPGKLRSKFDDLDLKRTTAGNGSNNKELARPRERDYANLPDASNE